jgi:hypothetical protein
MHTSPPVNNDLNRLFLGAVCDRESDDARSQTAPTENKHITDLVDESENNRVRNYMKKAMQFLILISTITATSALLASGGIDGGGGNAMSPVTNEKWKVECSGCHMLYHPGLLPERSWLKMMNGLDKHFGENASLDVATRTEITNFLVANSAGKSTNRRSSRIDQSIPNNVTPLRITETRYFTSKHDEVSPTTFKRKSIGSAANCIACHKGAEKGDFSESQIRIPR